MYDQFTNKHQVIKWPIFDRKPLTVRDLEHMTLAELIEVCNTDPAHVAIARKPKARMIVSKSFAERWSKAPQHYRDHFNKFDLDVEIRS